MDPLSITAAAVGISEVATSSLTGLLQLIRRIEGADEELRNISSGLEAVTMSLAALSEIRHEDAEEFEKTKLKHVVDRCGQSCNQFRKFLNRWTIQSGDKLSLRAKWSIGLFRRSQVESLKEQIWACQSTVQLAVTSTLLLAQYRKGRNLGSDLVHLRNQLQGLTPKIEDHALVIGQQRHQAETRISELERGLEGDEDDSIEPSAAIREFEDLLRVLEASNMSNIIISKQIRSALMQQDIGDVTTSDDSTAWVGVPESIVGRIECQRIGDVVTSARSTSHVGVFVNTQGAI